MFSKGGSQIATGSRFNYCRFAPRSHSRYVGFGLSQAQLEPEPFNAFHDCIQRVKAAQLDDVSVRISSLSSAPN
jgi:hypothetical protein